MMDVNVVILVGRLTAEPELKYTQSGKAVAKFTLAINHNNSNASFFDVVVWGKQAENCQNYLDRGDRVAVIGSLYQDRWEYKEKKYTKVVIYARQVQFLSEKRRQNIEPENIEEDEENLDDFEFEEIPF